MNRFSSVRAAIVVWLLFVSGPGRTIAAQTPDDGGSNTVATLDEIESDIAALEAQQAIDDLSDEEATRLQLLRSAQTALEAAARSIAQSTEFDDKESQVPVELEAIRAELAKPPVELKPEVTPDATLAEMDNRLKAVQTEVDTARARLREVEAELDGRDTRLDEIREQQATLQHDLQDIDARMAALPLPDESPALTAARLVKLQADAEATRRWIDVLEQERENTEARRELTPLRRDRLVRRINQLTVLEAAWQALVDQARAADIRRKREEAMRAASLAHPVVAGIAAENLELADRRDQLRPDSERAQQQLVSLTPDPETLRRQLDRLQQKVDVVGMTSTVGLLLRKNRAELPDTRTAVSSIRQRRALMAEVEYERLEHEDQREALLVGEEATIRRFLAELDPMPPDAELTVIEQEIRELLRVRRDYLDALDVDLSTYFDRLQALNEADEQIVELTGNLTSFIDQHILWIQSAPPLTTGDLRTAGTALAWMFDAYSWRVLAARIWTTTTSRWPLVAVVVILLLGLLGLRRRMGRKIQAIGASLAAPERATFGQITVVSLFTFLRALLWPAAAWAAGQLLHVASDESGIELGLAVGDALRNLAGLLFVLMLAYQACLPQGLGESHFGWRPRNVRVARRQIAWMSLVIMGFGMPVSIMAHQSVDAYEQSLGRLAFMAAVVGLAFCVHGLLNPRTGIMSDYLVRNSANWANRLRYIWYPAAVLTPLTLAVASGLGYHYTAVSICREVLDSAAYLVVVVLVYYLVLRWIQLGQRKMAMEQARKRTEAYEQRAARGEDAGEAPPNVVKSAQFDVSAISTQALQMLRAAVLFMLLIGFFAIWSESIPAIGFLERVELWQGSEVTASGAAVPAYDMVTMQDLLGAMVLAVLTVIVAKNIPGLLEITVLQHLPLERGSQFAISTIVRYAITIVGVAVAFRAIGVTWAKVQWMAAALTVGLGFGLNEIFGNFIAGLIILFERPIRVGDTVTIGQTTGTVNQIKIRSTTLLDWDRKELVIPNKVFVTDTIVNWTLTSPLLRLVFPVTLAHGSDTALAEDILLRTAGAHPNVVKDPAPSVMFKGVDEKGLTIDLRLFIPHIDHFVKVKHEIYNAIVSSFGEAGVRFFEFSHRDIEVRSMSGAPIS